MKKTLLSYLLFWYLWTTPKEILRGWRNILWYNLKYFSILFLLKTLLAPWRRTQWKYGRKFDVAKWLEAWSGNFISRILGAFIRLNIIVVGLMAEVILIPLGPFVLILWFLAPFLFFWALGQGIFVLQLPDTKAFLSIGASLLGMFLFARSFWQNWQLAKPIAKTNTLAQFLKKEQGRLRFIFNRLLLNPKQIIKSLEQMPLSPRPVQGFPWTGRGGSPEEIMIDAAQKDPQFQRVLLEFNITPKDIEEVADWFGTLKKRAQDQKQWYAKKNLRKYGTLGRQWTSGFSPLLDRFSFDISQEVRKLQFPQLVGHEKELKALERVLARDQINNVLLVGEPGSGRKSIVQQFAVQSILGETLQELNHKRVVQLEIPALLAALEGAEETEAALDEIFQEVMRAGNIVLVIDELHNFVGIPRPGTINITGIISKYLASPLFPVIGITTFAGLHRDIEQNPSILSLVEKVETQEITKKQALEVLESIIPFAERKYKVFVPYQTLRDIIELSQKYIQAVPLPKKALDILDEAFVYISQSKENILVPKHIAEIIAEKTQIPVGDIQAKEKETLLNLEDLIHQRIINQEEAVKEVASALRRSRTQVGSKKGPMGSFLFMGPTGVGKTETAKALAAIYFGSENRMIRLDMSEFQNMQDIQRLLGSPGQEGLLTTAVREDPFSLLLLDELEKAHSNILNLFLQVLDEGHVTDGLGRKIDFSHTIIIATSNAGYQIILRALKENADFPKIKQEIFDYVFQEGIFRPEFLNRFDGVVLFQPLSRQHVKDIAGLMLKKTQKNLKEKGIEFQVTEALKAKIAELGYNPQFGARDIKRVIQDKVENALATALLKGEIKRGNTIELDLNFTLTVQKE